MTLWQILVEEVDLIPTLILSPYLLILQIATGGHKAVDLVAECIVLARHLQRFLQRLDSLRILVTGDEEVHGHGDVGSVVGVDRRRASFGCGRELAVGAVRVGDDLGKKKHRRQQCPMHVSRADAVHTLPPQHIPTTPHFSILPPALASMSLITLGMVATVFGGVPAPWKKVPSLAPFSGVSRGNSAAEYGSP